MREQMLDVFDDVDMITQIEREKSAQNNVGDRRHE
jgi:hypothetical protein